MIGKNKRRLTTILCVDVEGYARLMEADEVSTLAMLRRCRAAMATLIERHEGRIVNICGDAIIAVGEEEAPDRRVQDGSE